MLSACLPSFACCFCCCCPCYCRLHRLAVAAADHRPRGGALAAAQPRPHLRWVHERHAGQLNSILACRLLPASPPVNPVPPPPRSSSHPVCDPVMGDDGRLYARPDLPPAFRDLLVPLASVLTPNQFEAELLTGRQVASEAQALAACAELHARGPHTVVGGGAGVVVRGWWCGGGGPGNCCAYIVAEGSMPSRQLRACLPASKVLGNVPRNPPTRLPACLPAWLAPASYTRRSSPAACCRGGRSTSPS